MKNLLLLCFSSVLCLFFAEAAVRLLVPEHLWRAWNLVQDVEIENEIGWQYRKNLRLKTKTIWGWSTDFQTNADGILPVDAKREKADDELRIMIFGDSTVVGRMVLAKDRLHHRLKSLLAESRKKISVLNAGVEAYSTDQALAQMERLLPLYKPDIVLYGLCDNDINQNLMGKIFGVEKVQYVFNSEGKLEKRLPTNKREDFIGGGHFLRVALYNSAIYQMLRPFINRLRSQKTHPSLLNFISVNLFTGKKHFTDEELRMLKALLVKMQSTAREHRAKLLLYAHPLLHTTWWPIAEKFLEKSGIKKEDYRPDAIESVLQKETREYKIPYCELVDYFLNQQERGPFHLIPKDGHANAMGYLLTAERLAECIKQLE